jgi:hypothetical protein
MMQVKPLIPRLGEDNKQKQQQQQPAAKHKPNTTTTKPIEKGSNPKS